MISEVAMRSVNSERLLKDQGGIPDKDVSVLRLSQLLCFIAALSCTDLLRMSVQYWTARLNSQIEPEDEKVGWSGKC